MLTQRSSNPRLQLDELKVAAHQFQSAVGSELLVTELDRKLLLDRLPQPPYLQPHLWGLRVVPSGVTAALQMTRQSPFFFDQIVESTRIIFGSRLGIGCWRFWSFTLIGQTELFVKKVNQCWVKYPS